MMSRQGPISAARDTTSAHTPGGIYYEVHGAPGPPLFLAFPVMASLDVLPVRDGMPIVTRFLAGLTDRYRVLVADYPSVSKSATIPPSELTVGRVCSDMLEIADAAGFDEFAWWGGTFGAVIGLHLASSTDRLTALVSAGWPPLAAPYDTMLRGVKINVLDPPESTRVILREPAQYAQWVTFYESLSGWDEAAAVAKIECPRMLPFGSNALTSVADLPLPLSDIIRDRRAALESLGWQLVELPGHDSALILDAEALVPVVRPFLDRVL